VDEKQPKVMDALKKNVFKNVVSYLRAQAPAIFNKKQDNKQQAQIKRNTDALVEVRKEIVKLRTALRKNQQLIQSLQRNIQVGVSQSQPAQTFTPSAIQQTVGRVGVLGGRYLFDRATRQYTTPQGRPVATAAIKESVAGASPQSGLSGLGLGAAALATSGLGMFLRGKYRTKAIGAGARMMKDLGVPKFARRAVMQGAGRMALGAGVRLLANPYTLGLTAIAGILLPRDVKNIIGGVLEGFLKGVGLDKDLVDTVMSVYDKLVDLSERFKEVVVDIAKRLYAIVQTFLTPEGRERVQQALRGVRGTEGIVPGSSSGAEMGGIPGNPPSPDRYQPSPATTQQPSEQRAAYDTAKKQLTESKKTLDDKIKTYQRIVSENNFPKTATNEQKEEFKQSIGKLIELQDNIDKQLKQPASSQVNYKAEAEKLNNLSNAVRNETDKTRILYNKMEKSGEPVSQSPAQIPPEPQTSRGPETQAPTQPPPAGSVPEIQTPVQQPLAGGVPVVPETEGSTQPSSADGAPVTKPSISSTLSNEQPKEPPSVSGEETGTEPVIPVDKLTVTGQNFYPDFKGPISPAMTRRLREQEPRAYQEYQQYQQEPMEPAVSTGKELIERSQNLAQMRYSPRTQNVDNNYIDNSRKITPDVSEEAIRHIPSPVASRADLDVDTIFNAIA